MEMLLERTRAVVCPNGEPKQIQDELIRALETHRTREVEALFQRAEWFSPPTRKPARPC